MATSDHEIQAPTTTEGIEQQEKFNGSLDNENTNEEEQNSTKQTNNKSPEDELDIELLPLMARQFPVIWNTRLNGFKYYNNKKVIHGTVSAVLEIINM